MDLLVAVAVWSLGAWVAYRWTRRQGEHRPGADTEPRRRQEGMDVRRRRGRGRGYRSSRGDAATDAKLIEAARTANRSGPDPRGS